MDEISSVQSENIALLRETVLAGYANSRIRIGRSTELPEAALVTC